jgi:hypothetical protein
MDKPLCSESIPQWLKPMFWALFGVGVKTPTYPPALTYLPAPDPPVLPAPTYLPAPDPPVLPAPTYLPAPYYLVART